MVKKPKKISKAGRPDEGRVRMNVHVLPATAEKINQLVSKADTEKNTQGKIIDRQFAGGED